MANRKNRRLPHTAHQVRCWLTIVLTVFCLLVLGAAATFSLVKESWQPFRDAWCFLGPLLLAIVGYWMPHEKKQTEEEQP